MTFKVGDRVQIDCPEHYTHERTGEVRRDIVERGWFWVLLDGECGPRSYPAHRLRAPGAGVNPDSFETSTGALAR